MCDAIVYALLDLIQAMIKVSDELALFRAARLQWVPSGLR